MDLSVIILAAGQGKRMKSALPKVLHCVGGKPILQHIVDVAQSLAPQKISIVHAPKASLLPEKILGSIVWVEQPIPQGTADAVRCALPHVLDNTQVLILLGDVPLISQKTLDSFIQQAPQKGVAFLTALVKNPYGLGRVVRNAQKDVVGIVEEKDASETEKNIQEINTGIFLVSASLLKKWIPLIQNNNAQKEFYLTDICALAHQEGAPVVGIQTDSTDEIQGVNDMLQLVTLERIYQRRLAESLLLQGVFIVDPERFDVRGDLTVASEVRIDANVIFEGRVFLGKGSSIGPNCVLKNCQIGSNVRIEAFTHCEGVTIEDGAAVGPFARLRKGTHLKAHSKVGNFVETKNTILGEGSKVGHLSYLGDATVGRDVNIGAGTITCNFDGLHKHLTVIEDGAFIGSHASLVAPVTVGHGATIGAGTVLTKDAPPEKLTLARAFQKTISSWKRKTIKESKI